MSWASTSADTDRLRDVVDNLVMQQLEQREQARAAKDFARADQIRDDLTASGVVIEDTPEGARWSLSESDGESDGR